MLHVLYFINLFNITEEWSKGLTVALGPKTADCVCQLPDDLSTLTVCGTKPGVPGETEFFHCPANTKGQCLYVYIPDGSESKGLVLCEVQVIGTIETPDTESTCGTGSLVLADIPTLGGTADQAKCNLPFTYKNQQYNSCILANNHRHPWCSAGDTEGQWGYCDMSMCE